MAANKHPGGRPPKYKCKEEIEGLIEAYFKACEGEVLKDDDDIAVTDKYGQPIIIGAKPPTVTGLALALGFTTRLSLLNYQGKAEFMNTITRAKTLVEEYAETRLFDRDGVRGAQFSLINNFKGWSDKPDTEHTNGKVEDDPLTESLERAINGKGIITETDTDIDVSEN